MKRITQCLFIVLAATSPSDAAVRTNAVERSYDRFGRPVGLSVGGERRAEFTYRYDDVGNRLWSREFGTDCTYAANGLNQYTKVVRGRVSERSAFDLDGNQTNVVTATGEWAVEYNGENGPVRWTRASDGKTVLMSYDRMGRRVTKDGEAFVYDGYLNVGRTVWDPTEPVATRPLAWLDEGGTRAFLFHDANKNVAGIVSDKTRGEKPTTIEYAPFGAILTANETAPWLFSSEYSDITLGLSYFNEDKTRWKSKKLKVSAPIPNTKCCKDAEYTSWEPSESGLSMSGATTTMMTIMTCAGTAIVLIMLSPIGM